MHRVVLMALFMMAGSASAEGDSTRGKQAWTARCASCHAVDVNRIGPKHGGVFGRKAGSVPDFNFSPALKAAGHAWDAATLDRWLTDPEKFVPGQRMFVKVPEMRDRQDIIAYLRTLKP